MNYSNITERRVLCYGDSNTYGYDPARDGRYGEDERYPRVLQHLLGSEWAVIEEGLPRPHGCLRRPHHRGDERAEDYQPHLNEPCPAGHRDHYAGHQRQQGAVRLQFLFNSAGITRLVKKALRTECWRDNAHPDVLVIVPPSITPEYDKLKFREEMGPGCHERCAGIAAQLEPMLKDLPGVRFLDANLLPGAGCSPVDGMHLTPEAHKAVAEALKNALTGVTL